jgi:Zn-dependent M28 family amino/carboxypeptidase
MDCGRELLSNEAHDLDAAIATLAGQTTCSFALLKKAEVDVNARYNSRARTANVVARLEGSDRVMRNELIVVGASLDGSGIQGETCLFPGADINASGVAAVLETARILSQSGYSPKRSVLFVLFSGGEQQWLGSREFLAQYPRLSRVEAFLNPQNIGCGDSLVVLGDNHYPTLWEICHSHDTAADRRFMVHAAEKTNPRGDARAFDSRRIPSLVITTYNGLQHNHVSSDIWENINRSILTKATQLLVETTAELADGLYQGRGPKSKGNRY